MEKIISLFVRDFANDPRYVTRDVTPGAEWVIAGEGRATQKLDGTACLVKDGKLYKRYDAKHGKPLPPNFMPAQEPDPITGHHPGWVPVGDGPEDRWHREAFEGNEPNGTYELIGPKIQGNPEHMLQHILSPHGKLGLENGPRDFDSIMEYLRPLDVEGIVWHHPDGRMVKIKKSDFGMSR